MDERFAQDIQAFKSVEPILTYRCWKVLVGLGVIDCVRVWNSIDYITKMTEIKNIKMLSCMLNFLVGKKILKKKDDKFIVINPPIFPTKEDLLFLYQTYYRSMMWVDSVSLCSAAVLVKNKPLDLMGFGNHSDLELWEAIMSESPYSFRKFLLEKILDSKKDNFSILDFGCGGGIGIEQMIELTKHPLTITGVDPSAAYLEKAKERLSSSKLISLSSKKNIKTNLFVHNYLVDKSLTDKFDAIFMSLVLNHLSEKEISILFKKLRTYLKSDGVLGIYQIINNSETERSPLCWVMHVVPSHKCYPDKKTYLRLLRENFDIVDEYFFGNVIIARNTIRKK